MCGIGIGGVGEVACSYTKNSVLQNTSVPISS